LGNRLSLLKGVTAEAWFFPRTMLGLYRTGIGLSPESPVESYFRREAFAKGVNDNRQIARLFFYLKGEEA